MQGKVEARTDVTKKSNKSEYGNFLNTSGIMTFGLGTLLTIGISFHFCS